MSAALPGTFPRAYGRFLNPGAMPEYSKHTERACARARLLTALTPHPQARPQGPAPVFLLGNIPSEVLLFQPRYEACIRHSPAYYPSTMPHGQQAELSLAPAHLSSTFSCYLPIFILRSRHTKLLRLPGKTLLFPFSFCYKLFLSLQAWERLKCLHLGDRVLAPQCPDSFTYASLGTNLTVLQLLV